MMFVRSFSPTEAPMGPASLHKSENEEISFTYTLGTSYFFVVVF